jgi:hypothetical protein
MDPLAVPEALQAFQFAGVIAWQVAVAVLFWIALVRFRDRHMRHEPWVVLAMIVNLGLWAAFQVLDEVFLAYQPEAVHRVIFLNQLATVLLLHSGGRSLPAPRSTP